VFILVWVVTAAALGVVISIQNDPPDSLKTAVFCFSIITFVVLLLGFVVWYSLAPCTVNKVCQLQNAANSNDVVIDIKTSSAQPS
jgi:hypothetical protein